MHNDRVANGGNSLHRSTNRSTEQNAASRQIYDSNHNGNTIKPNSVDNREANQQQRKTLQTVCEVAR